MGEHFVDAVADLVGRELLRVRVNCESDQQFIGMARYSLYFRLDDSSKPRNLFAFAINLFAFGFVFLAQQISRLFFASLVYFGNDKSGEINHLFQSLNRQIQNQADFARH